MTPKIEIMYKDKDSTTTSVDVDSKQYFSILHKHIELLFPENLYLYTENMASLGLIDYFPGDNIAAFNFETNNVISGSISYRRRLDRMRPLDDNELTIYNEIMDAHKFNIVEFFKNTKVNSSVLERQWVVKLLFIEFGSLGNLFVKAVTN